MCSCWSCHPGDRVWGGAGCSGSRRSRSPHHAWVTTSRHYHVTPELRRNNVADLKTWHLGKINMCWPRVEIMPCCVRLPGLLTFSTLHYQCPVVQRRLAMTITHSGLHFKSQNIITKIRCDIMLVSCSAKMYHKSYYAQLQEPIKHKASDLTGLNYKTSVILIGLL